MGNPLLLVGPGNSIISMGFEYLLFEQLCAVCGPLMFNWKANDERTVFCFFPWFFELTSLARNPNFPMWHCDKLQKRLRFEVAIRPNLMDIWKPEIGLILFFGSSRCAQGSGKEVSGSSHPNFFRKIKKMVRNQRDSRRHYSWISVRFWPLLRTGVHTHTEFPSSNQHPPPRKIKTNCNT